MNTTTTEQTEQPTLKDLVIIGGGPAGLSAALYAQRALLDIVILEQEALGGQMIVTDKIDNYLGVPHINGYELSEIMHKQVKDMDVPLCMERVDSLKRFEDEQGLSYFLVHTSRHSFKTKAVLIACGATAKEAEFKGESRYTGHGVSYCATCDAMFYRDKPVYVVGGGNAACEEGLFLARFAKKVTLLVRRDVLRAQDGVIRQVQENPKMEIVYNTRIKELTGESDEGFTSITLENTKTRSTETITCEPHGIGVFVFAGRKPMNQLVGQFIDTDKNGFIKTDDHMQTRTEGLYAAGDVRDKVLRQLITAASDGAVAATSAASYIRKLKRASKTNS